MLSPELSYLVSQEQHNDRIRQFEQQQQLQIIEPEQTVAYPKQYQQAANWLGHQMIKWGTKLQSL